MKKLYIAIFIFLLTIGISSFSYCADTTLARGVDLSAYFDGSVNLDSLAQDMTTYIETNYNIDTNEYSNFFSSFFAVSNTYGIRLFWYDTFTENSANWANIDVPCFEINIYNMGYVSTQLNLNHPFGEFIVHDTDVGWAPISTGGNVTLYDLITTQTITYNGEDIAEKNYGDTTGEGGGEGGGDTEEGGILDFIANFWSNLLHIVVPTEDQWDELQENWEDNVLGKFNIQAWSFNENDYNYSNSNEWLNNDAPEIPINILGGNTSINMQSINTWLNTPFNFGKKKLRYSSSDVVMETDIDNGGLTIRKLLILSMTIDIFVLNIYLFNKFFSKED